MTTPAAVDRATHPLPDAPPLPWREAVERVPSSFVLFVFGIAAIGVAAGALAMPLFYWTTPAIATLLVAGAADAVRRNPDAAAAAGPAANGESASARALPRDVRPLVAETVQRLEPEGAARELLDDVVRLAASLYAATAGVARHRYVPEWWRARAGDGGVGELVAAACDCALALDRADEALLLLRESGPAATAPAAHRPLATDRRRREAALRCERAREALSQRLVETVTALGAACAQAADRAATGDDAARLSELARELARDAELRRAASEEVEALLGAGANA